jgi:NhaP-type Na+/H+ or K+/H+ antiporter
MRNKDLQVSPPFAVISDAGDGSVSLVFPGGIRWRESALLSWNNLLWAFLFFVVCFSVGVGSVSCFYLAKGVKLNSPAMGSRSGLSTTDEGPD